MRYVSPARVLRAHEHAIRLAGGTSGIRSMELLLSAVASARQAAAYGEKDVASLAAGLAYALAKNHAFLDGNKRTAFLAMDMFLRRNGYRVRFEPTRWAALLEGLAAGTVSRDALAHALRAVLPRRRINPGVQEVPS